MRLPPHKFVVWGKLWTLRYGDPKSTDFQCQHRKKIRWGTTFISPRKRVVYLHPMLRQVSLRKMLWETFAHELLHVFDLTTKGSHGKYRLREKQIYRLETAFGSMLSGNVLFLEAPLSALRKKRRAVPGRARARRSR